MYTFHEYIFWAYIAFDGRVMAVKSIHSCGRSSSRLQSNSIICSTSSEFDCLSTSRLSLNVASVENSNEGLVKIKNFSSRQAYFETNDERSGDDPSTKLTDNLNKLVLVVLISYRIANTNLHASQRHRSIGSCSCSVYLCLESVHKSAAYWLQND